METIVNFFRSKNIFFVCVNAVLSLPFYDFRSINYNNNSVRLHNSIVVENNHFFFQHDQNVYYRQPITLEFITFVFTIEYGSHCVRIILKYKIH